MNENEVVRHYHLASLKIPSFVAILIVQINKIQR